MTKCLREHNKVCLATTPTPTPIVSAPAPASLVSSSISREATSVPSTTSVRALPPASTPPTARHPFPQPRAATSQPQQPPRTPTPSTAPPETTAAASRLNELQTIVSFVPHASSSSSTSNPVPSSIPLPAPKVQKKKQKSPPMSNDQATIEFLRTELGAAQARIVILDASIVDKDKELSVLWARVQILEEKQNKELLDKYFPHKTAKPTVPKSSTSTSPCSSSSCTSCPMPCSCCRHHASSFSCCSRSSANNTSCCPSPVSDHPPDLYKKVLEVSQEVQALKNILISQKTPASNPEENTDPGSPSNTPTSANDNSDPKPANNHPHVSVSSDSQASVDEFIPDLQENEDDQANLNWDLQTNQL